MLLTHFKIASYNNQLTLYEAWNSIYKSHVYRKTEQGKCEEQTWNMSPPWITTTNLSSTVWRISKLCSWHWGAFSIIPSTSPKIKITEININRLIEGVSVCGGGHRGEKRASRGVLNWRYGSLWPHTVDGRVASANNLWAGSPGPDPSNVFNV